MSAIFNYRSRSTDLARVEIPEDSLKNMPGIFFSSPPTDIYLAGESMWLFFRAEQEPAAALKKPWLNQAEIEEEEEGEKEKNKNIRARSSSSSTSKHLHTHIPYRYTVRTRKRQRETKRCF